MKLSMKLLKTIIIFILLIPTNVMGQVTLVKDINTHPALSRPRDITQVGNVVFYICSKPEKIRELWRSDGTNDGTYKVKSISKSLSDQLNDFE